MFHVKTEENLADLGTRPEKVRISDVGPQSEWECGKPWMHGELSDTIQEGILKPISELRLGAEKDTEQYREGLFFGGDTPDMFCNAVNRNRVELLQLRVEFFDYLLLPTRFVFKKIVRIMAIVVAFINKCRKKVINSVDMSETTDKFRFSVLQICETAGVLPEETDDCYYGQKDLVHHFRNKNCKPDEFFALTQTDQSMHGMPLITDKYLHQALVYLYRKAAKEVMHFNTKAKVEKVATLKDGILFSKGRIIDGMNFLQTGGLEISDLGQLGIKAHIPVVDRHSPLAYSIANHVH